MYRNFLKKTLNRDQLKEINRNAPENVKFCNGICQDFRDKTNFSGAHVICNNCRNSINLADKQVKEGKITIDEFKENPDIVDGIEVVFDSNKTCSVCKQEKNISQFESNKNQCKACRSIQANERINKDIEILISDIEKTKNNLTSLEKFVRDISKDKLIKIISHFQVGRKATDTKERMVYNVVEHFRKLLNPLLCQGGCGYTLKEEFSYCGDCKNKKSRAINKKMDFEDNFDDIIEDIKNLHEIEEKDYDKYTRNQYLRISDKLDIKGLNTKSKKQEIIDKINEFLRTKNEEKQKILKESKSKESKNHKKEINKIIPNKVNQREIQLKLQNELDGEIEVETEYGFIDLLTEDEIIEIKVKTNWKNALGNILIYSLKYPKHNKRIHLFYGEPDEIINNACKIYDIKVTYE